MIKKHDFDAAWKSILEALEVEIVELLFPEIYDKIDWELQYIVRKAHSFRCGMDSIMNKYLSDIYV
ncbi:hypothetical protein [Clostridium estertheticum]|uniref:hypothetical protein n=1 Tax=Clostridium estertheticum TaxID=238834 RepID=UPI001CF5F247|nr:hypothetical protein [Clostridium estertheticum]MCB2357363.1 hypothetical protein [Clostridium estertheticum]WAG41913.1 hypothetical protein LL065_04180 [Clostridium estertheticum]